MGSEYTLDKEDLVNVIEKVNKLIETDELKLEEMGEKGKSLNNQNDREFDRKFKEFLMVYGIDLRKNTPLKNNYDCFDEELPLSVITPRNRKYLFDLAIRNFTNTDYPDKIEWIIVDDSEEENLQNILPK